MVYDAAVIGGGIVGLAVAREIALREGKSVVLIEREDALVASASSGNSGILCTGYDAPVDSLEEKLLRRSISKTPELLKSFGLQNDVHFKQCGSLVVAWTEEELRKLPHVLEQNQAAGDESVRLLSAAELLLLEPALSTAALGAVLCPQETVIDPWLMAMGYAESCRIHGVKIILSREVIGAKRSEFKDEDDANEGSQNELTWKLETRVCDASQTGRSEPHELLVANKESISTSTSTEGGSVDFGSMIIEAKVVINCAGLYGDRVEAMKTNDTNDTTLTNEISSSSSSFHIVPRKGQFVVYRPANFTTTTTATATAIASNQPIVPPTLSYIIEPIGTSVTKGVIVWRNIYGYVLVGPTATDQVSCEDRSTDAETIASLQEHAIRVCPTLRDATVIGTYAGLRPGTAEFRDYIIRSNVEENWIVCGGIRSTGVSASAAIGEYVAELYDEIEHLRHGIGHGHGNGHRHACDVVLAISDAIAHPVLIPSAVIPNAPMPSLQQLAIQYNYRNDGKVTLHGNGDRSEVEAEYRVTHPITSFALEGERGV